MARGCHQLIRQGAKLVESADDILSELAPLVRHLLELPDNVPFADEAPAEHDGDYAKLLSIVAFDPLSVDEIAARSGLTIEQVSSMLLILELEGLIESQPGGRYSRLLK
jgi:DNA processing protein